MCVLICEHQHLDVFFCTSCQHAAWCKQWCYFFPYLIKHWNDDYSTDLTLIISPAAGCGALWDGKRWTILSPSGVYVSWKLVQLCVKASLLLLLILRTRTLLWTLSVLQIWYLKSCGLLRKGVLYIL